MAAILRSIVSVDKKLIADIVDPSLIINDYVLEELMEVALIAKACLSRNPSKRPKMAEILNALEGLFAKKRIINIRQNGKIYLHGSLRIFTLGELNDATKNFGRECWLGRDEFGELYWGSLCEKSKSHGRTVSQILSKRMFPRRMRDIQQRQAEVEVLGRLSHPNILKLLGYCLEDGKLLLLYKFMQEGSLNKYFSGESTAIRELTWEKRLKILIGVARGIAFLHASHKQGFFQQKKEGEGFYGYINCSKIFTDSDHNPMITGFCVAEVDRPYDLVDVHPNAFTRGKYEYAALENKHSGRFSTMSSRLGSDVYGFGVILVRVLTGVDNHQHTSQITVLMRPLEFIERNMDQRLEGKISSKAAVRMVQPAQLCLAYDHTLRPPMEQVVEILEGIEKMANIKTLS